MTRFFDFLVLWTECLVGPALVVDLLNRGVPRWVSFLLGGFAGMVMMVARRDVLRKK